jgi:hypothetical protein
MMKQPAFATAAAFAIAQAGESGLGLYLCWGEATGGNEQAEGFDRPWRTLPVGLARFGALFTAEPMD